MNVAAILALLLNSGVCSKADFSAPGGATLRVVVCPMVQAPASVEPTPDAPAAPAARPDVQA